jgi:hypothetical protein
MISQRTRLLDGDGLWSPLTVSRLPYALSFVPRI